MKKGEAVVPGQKIGECGHSGHSSEPHLHFQLQDRANFYTAVSLPIRFRNVERIKDGARECIEMGFVEKGQMVRNVDTCISGKMETASFTKPGVGDLVVSFAGLLLTILGIVVIVARVVEIVLKLI